MAETAPAKEFKPYILTGAVVRSSPSRGRPGMLSA